MTEYRQLFIRQLKMMIYLLSIYVIGWGFTSWQTVFAGLALGTVFGMYHLWSMHHKINRLGQAVIQEKKVHSLGSLQRMAIAGLAVLIAMRFPETFHLVSVILGLMTYYIVIMIDFLIQSIHIQSRKRGE